MSKRKNKTLAKVQPQATGSAPKPMVTQQLSIRPYNVKSLSLTDWRNAQKAALNMIPRRVTLYDLYHDISTTDAQVIAVWGKRVDAVTSADWIFTDKDGNPVDEINELIDCIGWDELLTCILKSKAWGYSMAEPRFFINDNGMNEFSIYEIPEKHMRPEKGMIALDQVGDTGIMIHEGIYAKTIMEFGKPKDLGLLLSASMYAILKRGDISDWAEFIEIFGRGIIDATWDGFDEGQRKALAQTFESMGGGGIIIRPKGTDLQIHGNNGNASGQLQDSFATKMDGYISKALLGTTETTESSKSSGYAQAEVHQNADNKKHETDLTFVRKNLNSKFIKVLIAAGFNTQGGTFVLKDKTALSLKEQFDIHMKMADQLGIPYDDDFFYEKYGMPRPKNYDALKKAIEDRKNADLAAKQVQENADTPVPPKEKRGKKSGNQKEELTINPSLWKRIVRLFQPAPAQLTLTTGATNPMCCGDRHIKVNLALFVADKVYNSLSDGLIKRAWDAEGEMVFDSGLYAYTARTLISGFSDGWKTKPVKLASLGMEYGVDDPAALTAYEMNLFRFAGVKTLFEAQKLNELFRKSKTFKEFYDTASSMLKVHNRDWLETEYNTAIAVGESAATYNRLMKQVEIFPYWEYKTAGDEKVRFAHQLLEGIILRWDHPAWKKIFPPNDWNCRCFIVARTKGEVTKEQLAQSEAKVAEYMESEYYKKEVKSGWGINRADKGEVFTENQNYTSNLSGAITSLEKLGFADYKLDDIKTVYEKSKAAEFVAKFGADEREEAIEDFISSITVLNTKKYVLDDFNKRKLQISKTTIRKHTNANIEKYADRHIYLSELGDVLKKPDEVWLGSYGSGKLNNYVYLKHYSDFTLVVIGRLKDDLTLEIETWYTVTTNELRKGLLVKN